MTTASPLASSTPRVSGVETVTTDFVTFSVADQMFGIPVLKVQDILVPSKIAPVPLAPPEVRGSINLRGRIVTVVDVRTRLGLSDREGEAMRGMGVTVEHGHELYTLLVDTVGDVVSLAPDLYEATPSTLDPQWAEFADGVYRLESRLMVVLNTDRLLDVRSRAA